MRISAFNGGLNTRVDASLIRENEARVYSNIDSDTAVLTPIKDSTVAESSIQRYSHFNTIAQEWVSSNTLTDWLEYQERLYTADRVNRPTKTVGSAAYNLGITAPVGTITLTAEDAPVAVERVSFTSFYDAGADLLEDSYSYKVVNSDPATGLRSTSFFVTTVEDTSAAPAIKSFPHLSYAGLTNNVSSATAALAATAVAVKYTNFHSAIVEPSDNAISISVDDTKALEVQVFRLFDGTWYSLSSAPQDPSIVVEDKVLNRSSNSVLFERERVNGIIQYAITYASTITGAESAPLLTDEVEVLNGRVELTGIPISSDPQVDQKNVYRIGGNLTAFTLVAAINPLNTSYIDTLADTDLPGTLLTSQDYDPAPAGLQYLTEAYAMLFGALEDKLRFTPIGKPDAWPTHYFLDFPSTITGISKTAIGLLVHTYFKTYLVTGTGPTSFAQQILANDQGCVSHDSIQETKDTSLWVSTDGICMSDGSDVKVISRDKLGKLTLDPVNAVLYDQVYQVLDTSGDVLALDFERGIFKSFAYGVDFLVTAKDTLYGHSSGQLLELNSSTSSLSMSWTSPDYEGTGLTQTKVYTDIFFYSSGSISINVKIDGVSVSSYSATTADLHQVKIPHSSRRGSYITFQITGTGELRELRWDEATANG